MRTLQRLCYVVAIAALAAGCGSGSRHAAPGAGPADTRTGAAAATIRWPEASRLVPQAAKSIKIEMAQGATVISTQTVDAPLPGTSQTITFNNLPVGDLTARAAAYPLTAAGGNAQAVGATTLTIQDGQTSTFSITMASTVDRIDVAPTGTTLMPGDTAQLTATAKNAAGDMILVAPGKLSWASATASVATVDPNTGVVTGVGGGTSTVTVTDAESGKSGSVTVAGVATGGRLAFSAYKDGIYGLYTVNASGGSLRKAADMPAWPTYGAPQWSPDGTRLLFLSYPGPWQGEILAARADGSGVTNLSNNPSTSGDSGNDWTPEWSPDGSQVAFITYRNGSPQVYVVSADGSNPINVSNPGPGSCGFYDPHWQPGGTQIACNGAYPGDAVYHLYLYSPPSYAPTKRTPRAMSAGEKVAWSPDGTRIAFLSGNIAWVINADGTNEHNASNFTGTNAVDFVWSPDGTKLAVTASDGEIYVVSQDGSSRVNVSGLSGGDSRPRWSPDSQRVLFQDTVGTIYVVNADGTGRRDARNGLGSIASYGEWSRDGTRIAFVYYGTAAEGGTSIRLANADGSGTPKVIATGANDYRDLVWAP